MRNKWWIVNADSPVHGKLKQFMTLGNAAFFTGGISGAMQGPYNTEKDAEIALQNLKANREEELKKLYALLNVAHTVCTDFYAPERFLTAFANPREFNNDPYQLLPLVSEKPYGYWND